MGGVIIKAVLKLWVIVAIISSFVLGAVGADLQCKDSQIKGFVQNHDTTRISFWYDIREMYAHITESFKKVP